jgi:hypothetical protein
MSDAAYLTVGHISCLAGRNLREPISYTIDDQPGLVRLWCDEFEMWGSGGAIRDAIYELQNALQDLWNQAVMNTTPDLDPPARAMRQRILWLMGDAPLSPTAQQGELP